MYREQFFDDLISDLYGRPVLGAFRKDELVRDILPDLQILRDHQPVPAFPIFIEINKPRVSDLYHRRPFRPVITRDRRGRRPEWSLCAPRRRDADILLRLKRLIRFIFKEHQVALAVPNDACVDDVKATIIQWPGLAKCFEVFGRNVVYPVI